MMMETALLVPNLCDSISRTILATTIHSFKNLMYIRGLLGNQTIEILTRIALSKSIYDCFYPIHDHNLRLMRPENLWNDEECNKPRRYVCRRPCTQQAASSPCSFIPPERFADQEFSETVLAAIVATVLGTIGLLVYFIRLEQRNIAKLEEKIRKIDEYQEEYFASKQLLATRVAEAGDGHDGNEA